MYWGGSDLSSSPSERLPPSEFEAGFEPTIIIIIAIEEVPAGTNPGALPPQLNQRKRLVWQVGRLRYLSQRVLSQHPD